MCVTKNFLQATLVVRCVHYEMHTICTGCDGCCVRNGYGVRATLYINPLTTDDECTRHVTLAACYQLAQTILKAGFVLVKKVR